VSLPFLHILVVKEREEETYATLKLMHPTVRMTIHEFHGTLLLLSVVRCDREREVDSFPTACDSCGCGKEGKIGAMSRSAPISTDSLKKRRVPQNCAVANNSVLMDTSFLYLCYTRPI
jgi:hypothetical protein